jgi:hypothetical protein
MTRRDFVVRLGIAWGLLSFLGGCFTLPARADSDGFFCTSKGYIAFDLRSFHTHGLKASHVLRVVRFGTERGIYEAGEVSLLDFQIHHMECTQDRVKMSGVNKGYIEYTIDISEPNKLKIVDTTQDPERLPSTLGAATEALGLSAAQTIPLESDDPAYIYKLVLARSEKRGKSGLERRSTAELIRVDSHGNTSQRLLLYDDHFIVSPD